MADFLCEGCRERDLAINQLKAQVAELERFQRETTYLRDEARTERDLRLLTGDSQAMNREQLLRLAGALAELPAEQRKAVELHHLKGWSLGEVAEHMGRSRAAVMGLVFRGIKKLREQLEEKGSEQGDGV